MLAMKFDPITTRKIGSIEVLLFALVFEALRANFLGVLVYVAAIAAFFVGRVQFGGDFSLAQLYGLLRSNKETPTP
jgi:hypothetical protein